MRAVALAILATSLSPAAALAADFDPGPLRGTEYVEPAAAPIAVWEGVYFGGFGGVSPSNFQIKGDPKAIVAPVVYNTDSRNRAWRLELARAADQESSRRKLRRVRGLQLPVRRGRPRVRIGLHAHGHQEQRLRSGRPHRRHLGRIPEHRQADGRRQDGDQRSCDPSRAPATPRAPSSPSLRAASRSDDSSSPTLRPRRSPGTT